MKCMICNGTGKALGKRWNGDEYVEELVNCHGCDGTGEFEMTNEYFLRTATTEQLAEWIAHQTMIALLENQNNHSLRMTCPAYWVEWLQQQHTDKE